MDIEPPKTGNGMVVTNNIFRLNVRTYLYLGLLFLVVALLYGVYSVYGPIVQNNPFLSTDCTYQGEKIKEGTTVPFYTKRTVEKKETCEAYATLRTCSRGTFLGDTSYVHDSCTVVEPFVGVNLNRKPEDLDVNLLNRSQATWIRANIDILNYYDGTWDDADFSAWDTFIHEQKNGKKGIVNLMWNFEERKQTLPRPNSKEEQELFAYLDSVILPKLLPSADIIVSGNEPFVNTMDTDWKYNESIGGTPLAIFYQRVTDHVHEYMVAHEVRDKHLLYVGAFTRIYDPSMQSGKGSTAFKELAEFAEQKSYVDGVDIHTHVSSLEEIDASLQFISSFTDKPIIVTEYTYIHLQKDKLNEQLDSDGGYFAKKYGLDGNLSVEAYMQKIKQKPVSKEEWDDFFKSRSWTIDHFILEANSIFSNYNVYGSTFGLVQGGITKGDSLPWYMGFLFSKTSVVYKNREPQPNYQYFDDFVSLQH